MDSAQLLWRCPSGFDLIAYHIVHDTIVTEIHLEHPKQDVPGNISNEQQMSVQHFIAIHKLTVELLQLVAELKNHSTSGAPNPIIAKVTHAGKWKKKSSLKCKRSLHIWVSRITKRFGGMLVEPVGKMLDGVKA